MDPRALYAPVAHLFPTPPARIADIGAGTGRDAAWLAGRGHRVTAVEPAAALRAAGRARYAGHDIEWIDDGLPGLSRLAGRAFDLLLLTGVWHHLDADQRRLAMPILADITDAGGTILLRIRHGATAPDRPGFVVSLAETVASAARYRLSAIFERTVDALLPANRAAGVTWTWLALRRNE